jgi:hypothetical protein
MFEDVTNNTVRYRSVLSKIEVRQRSIDPLISDELSIWLALSETLVRDNLYLNLPLLTGIFLCRRRYNDIFEILSIFVL